MCVQAIPLIAAAVSAAGTGLSISAAAEARDRMERALRGQIQKQEEFQRRATPIVEQSIDVASPESVRRQLSLGEQAASSLYPQLQGLPVTSAESPL